MLIKKGSKVLLNNKGKRGWESSNWAKSEGIQNAQIRITVHSSNTSLMVDIGGFRHPSIKFALVEEL